MTNFATTDATISPSVATPLYSEESRASGANWGSIVAGGVGATAVSLVLMTLGSALGMSAIAPWSSGNVASFTMKAAAWIIFTQWIASGLGGYIAGRLRTKWVHIHDDEIYFRDTAHGFLSWALATLLTALIVVGGASSIISGGAHSASVLAAGAMSHERPDAPRGNGMMDDPFAYYIDTLFRPASPSSAVAIPGVPPAATGEQSAAMGSNAVPPAPTMPPPPPSNNFESRGEVTRILLQGLKNGSVSDADKTYVAQVIAARAGISQQEAATRVDDTIAKMNDVKEQAKQKAEEARKTAMHVAFYLAFAMFVGAFIASFAATLGGRLRDEYHAEYHTGRKI